MKSLFFVSLFLTQSLFAEYRAFTLMITDLEKNQNRQFDSTLDPEQYRSYFTVKAQDKIVYIDTWLCKGNTSRLDQICPRPNRQPSSTLTPQQN